MSLPSIPRAYHDSSHNEGKLDGERWSHYTGDMCSTGLLPRHHVTDVYFFCFWMVFFLVQAYAFLLFPSKTLNDTLLGKVRQNENNGGLTTDQLANCGKPPSSDHPEGSRKDMTSCCGLRRTPSKAPDSYRYKGVSSAGPGEPVP